MRSSTSWRKAALLTTVTFIFAFVVPKCTGFHWLQFLHSSERGKTMSPSSRMASTRRKMAHISNMSYQNLPRVIVFDLDNTLWTPELYQLRRLQQQSLTPVAGKDVKMFEGAIKVIDEIIPTLTHPETGKPPMLAIASRTQSVAWAESLIDQFELRERFHAIEIFPASKTQHFSNIQQQTKVPFHEMMFFDDTRDGKYGNCIPVASLGVFCVHCPNGVTTENIFHRALDHYQRWDKSPNCIVEHDGRLTTNDEVDIQQSDTRSTTKRSRVRPRGIVYTGVVKLIRSEKRYGFIRYRTSTNNKNSREVFFHFNNITTTDDVSTLSINEGDEVKFQLQKDKNRKDIAVNVSPQQTHSSNSTVQFRCFSMNQPFAALLSNGYKTLETRNGTMFTQHAEGAQFLLHVGRRTYPDGGKHIEIMEEHGLSQDQIVKLKSLPRGFSRGMIVAILEIGQTYETTADERSVPSFEQRAVARGEDSGHFVTEIKRVAYLKQPVKQNGAGGVFQVRVPPEVIPDGEWYIPPALSGDEVVHEYASISG
jgi:magnesium-dependent phosphatase 1